MRFLGLLESEKAIKIMKIRESNENRLRSCYGHGYQCTSAEMGMCTKKNIGMLNRGSPLIKADEAGTAMGYGVSKSMFVRRKTE
ncbi:MAG TPA: hypothetical protein VMT62_01345 [Syntrophorhabdaceae bacterium]|nr:hypothetical protein [Syntrophorhabdaceae bacterium]